VQTIRALVEGYLRGRYSLAELGNHAFRVLALPVLVGAILLAGWLLLGPLLTIPRFTTEGPVVRNGVAAVVVCGKKSGSMNEKGIMAATKYAPEPGTGGWWPARRGECTVWYHRRPGPEQRYNRQQRSSRSLGFAHISSPSSARQPSAPGEDFVRACGRKVPAEQWDFAMGMRKDCGIYGTEDPLVASD
jgi:hypothetical protein